ncbi:MarR family winged helix-turn-helix transcriptional regulator [Microbacterium album]|uniref:MarR family transcriptional regulator n=1 Tax=Microbacterium album TaxID=2053191 RepID=A0A917IBH9_9MICO|nr:MarR family winged helix-turn-helix transcriptional regulator [Microbacterium album]GGH33546.1 MarR family transcriptional regulator [Microbacterium album]
MAEPAHPLHAEPLPWLLERTQSVVLDELHARLEAAGFDGLRVLRHGRVFRFIEAEGSRAQDLAIRTGLAKQTIAEVIEQLIALGYAERGPDPFDRRAKLVCLTERGIAAQRLASSALREIEGLWEERFGADEYRAFLSVLGTIASDPLTARAN